MKTKASFGLTEKELEMLKKLNSPSKIQNFLNELKINFEEKGDTCMSPRKVLETGKCHCIEGAMLAALTLRLNGHPPLIVDLTANKYDFDHVITVFQESGKWGAISKTNHAVLRYREPIYRDIRELILSFFHEYTDDQGRKTLRSFSMPVNLKKFDYLNWAIADQDLWEIANHLAEVKHYNILGKKQANKLRKADKIEIDAGKLVEYKK